MKSTLLALALVLAAPVPAYAVAQLIPAGALIQCTISEPKLSSKATAVGDPVLCQVGNAERYGRFLLPYNSYLEGRFEAYKDPGHFVGKGWMELDFDRMVIEPDTEISIQAKVVGVPGFNVDRQGRILGRGHAVRDTVAWCIPILWPIDVLNLPRRGPRPTLKQETRLVLKVMEDFGVPASEPLEQDPSGLLRRSPSAYTVPAPQPPPRPVPIAQPQLQPQSPAVIAYASAPYALAPALPVYRYYAEAAAVYAPYGQPPEESPVGHVQYRSPYTGPETRQAVTLVFNDGRPPERIYNYMLTPNTLYVLDQHHRQIPLYLLDVAATEEVNRDAGVDFRVPAQTRQ